MSEWSLPLICRPPKTQNRFQSSSSIDIFADLERERKLIPKQRIFFLTITITITITSCLVLVLRVSVHSLHHDVPALWIDPVVVVDVVLEGTA